MDKQIQLGKRTREVVLFYFNNPSLTQAQVAAHFQISVPRVSQIMNSERVLAAFPLLAKQRVRSLVPKAVQRLDDLMSQNENMAVSEKVVSKILDQAHVLTPSPQVVIHELRMKTTQELQDIIDVGMKIQGPVIDAEIVE